MQQLNYSQTPYIIHSQAPIRICDTGGWTDTWFAQYGEIFNIAVSPLAEVHIRVSQATNQQQSIVINAKNFEDRYAFNLNNGWSKHPLLEATVATMGVPENLAVEVTIFSQAPAGASTGTSAAVTVALIGALDELNHSRLTRAEVAATAQRIETELLGGECGIQDQLCSTYGGINYIVMYASPQAEVIQLELTDDIRQELESRLVLIYLGNSHSSTQIHKMVIQGLKDAGADCKQLEDLRRAARKSKDALIGKDFQDFGQAMIENTQDQARLHPSLIGSDAIRVIKIAQRHGAIGWKVNGAGGEGGSLTLLCNPDLNDKHALIHEIERTNPAYRHLPIRLNQDGLRVWREPL